MPAFWHKRPPGFGSDCRWPGRKAVPYCRPQLPLHTPDRTKSDDAVAIDIAEMFSRQWIEQAHYSVASRSDVLVIRAECHAEC
jgi:hypothetical protein